MRLEGEDEAEPRGEVIAHCDQQRRQGNTGVDA
jgi:hypothetical protein